MAKKLLIGLGIVLLIVAVLIWRVAANLDSIVAGVIEETGTEALQTSVRVSGVSISLKEARAGIAGLTIANPPGYSSENLFALEGIEVDLALESLGQDVLVIESVHIDKPQISYEGDKAGGSNLQSVLDKLEAAPAQKGGDLKIIIDSLEFSGGTVKASSALKPGESMNIELKPFSMSGIGREQGGVAPEVAAEIIAKKLLNKVINAAARAGVDRIIEDQKKGLMDKLGKKLKGDG